MLAPPENACTTLQSCAYRNYHKSKPLLPHQENRHLISRRSLRPIHLRLALSQRNPTLISKRLGKHKIVYRTISNILAIITLHLHRPSGFGDWTRAIKRASARPSKMGECGGVVRFFIRVRMRLLLRRSVRKRWQRCLRGKEIA